MLIIKPIQDKDMQKSLCAACETAFDVDSLAYGAWLADKPENAFNGTFLGICQFKLGETAHILCLSKAKGTDDTEAMFIMGRQTMNFIDLHGVHSCTFEGDCEDKFIRWLGFTKNEKGIWTADLETFFKHPCASERTEK